VLNIAQVYPAQPDNLKASLVIWNPPHLAGYTWDALNTYPSFLYNNNTSQPSVARVYLLDLEVHVTLTGAHPHVPEHHITEVKVLIAGMEPQVMRAAGGWGRKQNAPLCVSTNHGVCNVWTVARNSYVRTRGPVTPDLRTRRRHLEDHVFAVVTSGPEWDTVYKRWVKNAHLTTF